MFRDLIKYSTGCFFIYLSCAVIACNSSAKSNKVVRDPNDTLPEPFATKSSRNNSSVTGWPEGKTPTAPAGFVVTKFAGDLHNPRWIYIGPNKDIFIAEAATRNNTANSIVLLRDNDHDGKPESRKVFLDGLNRPFGMLILKDKFYVANTDGLYMYPYQAGQDAMTAEGKKILSLPAGGYNNHWTRNIIANKDGTKIFVSVGSGSNVGENGIEYETRRANILEINPDGSGESIYAAGLRNPVGMDFEPVTGNLWTAVNERDNLGDNLVPDYATSVKRNAFYGWPYAYFGKHEDPRRKGERPDLVESTIAPDVDLGSHTASLGLAFCPANNFPAKYKGGMFIGQHGSWNSSVLVGYKVVFVPFSNGKPSGPPEDFLSGFIADQSTSKVYGRPVCVAFLPDGSMLVTDDAANVVWRVSWGG